MKYLHLFIIGFLMLIFAWSTLLVEGKDNKKDNKAGKFFKKVGKVAKDVGKTALEVIKDPRKGIALAKDGIKAARGAIKGKKQKLKKKVIPTKEMCRLNWKMCAKQANRLYVDDEMTKQYERAVCHQNYLECMRQT